MINEGKVSKPDLLAAGLRWYQLYRAHQDETALRLAIQVITDPGCGRLQRAINHHPASTNLTKMIRELDTCHDTVSRQQLALADRIALAESLICVVRCSQRVIQIDNHGTPAHQRFRKPKSSLSIADKALHKLSEKLIEISTCGELSETPTTMPEGLYELTSSVEETCGSDRSCGGKLAEVAELLAEIVRCTTRIAAHMAARDDDPYRPGWWRAAVATTHAFFALHEAATRTASSGATRGQ